MREINSDVYTLSVIAAQIVSFERDELIQKVRDEYDTFGPMLMKLCEGGETLKGLTELMTAAEVTTVPEPMTLALFGAGLAGLAVIRRRRKA